MAIELITAPTGGAPVSTDDYDAQNLYTGGLFMALAGFQMPLTEWTTTTVPDLAQYSYFWHGGALYQVKDSDYTIGGSPSNGLTYIKLSVSGSELVATFVNSIAGYTWNHSYNGFYSGTDQVLPYVLYKNAASYKKYAIIYKNTDWATNIKTVDDIIIEADDKNFCLGADGASDFKMYWNGSHVYLESAGAMVFKTDGDTDDFIYITTAADVPCIATSGSCDLKITSSSGTIDFDDEDLVTTGDISGTNIDATSDMSCDILTCNGIELENRVYGSQSVGAGSEWIPAKGLYLIAGSDEDLFLSIYDGGTWRHGVSPIPISGLVYFDGTNMKIENDDSSSHDVYYFLYT